MEITKDISIGQDKWIIWIDLDQNSMVFNIDADIKPTEKLWEYLETECVRECCGIDAYSLWSEDIEKAKTLPGNPNIKKEFINLRKKMFAINEYVICSSYLNNLFDKSVFIELLDHIIDNL